MKKLSKLMAIVLTLTVLVSLFAFAVPTSGDLLAWSAMSLPGLTNNRLVATATDVVDVAISPNYAKDKSVFAVGANGVVYRSTNGGYNWTAMTTSAITGLSTIVVSPNYASDKTIVVATTTTVYRSTDGGATFGQLGVVTLAGGEVITSLDIAPNYDGTGVIAVSVANTTAATFATATRGIQAWGVSGALNWSAIGPPSFAGVDVAAVKYSPSYPVDASLLAITTDGGTGTGATATATVGTLATATATVAAGIVTAIAVTAGGTGYTAAPTVTITGVGTGATATATVAAGVVTAITVTAGGTGYTVAPTVTISAPGVTAIAVTAGGAGYPAVPTVTITGDGTGATATATVAGGAVTAITVTAGGAGYTAATVAISMAGNMALPRPYLRARVGSTWDTSLSVTDIGATAVTDVGAAGTSLTSASVAVPSDYNASVSSTRRVYVAIVGVAGYGTTTSNVYRVTGAGGTALKVALDPSVQIGDLAYSGTYGAGILIGGLYDVGGGTAAQVYRTTNPADAAGSVLWNSASNGPTGALAAGTGVKVAIDSAFATSKLVVAGTTGTDSAFAVSTDGSASVFNETGLIDNGGVALASVGNVALSPSFQTDKTAFILTNAAGGSANDTSLWRTKDSGTTWARLFLANFTTAGSGTITLSPAYDTDSTLWVGNTGGTGIQYSANKGDSWASRTAAVTIAGIAATDANTLYVANGGGITVSKSTNNGWTWSSKTVTDATTPLTSVVAKGSVIVVGDSVGAVFRSDDAASNWAQVGTAAPGGANAVIVAVDGDYNYAQDATSGDVYRFQKGVSTTWKTMTTTPAAGAGLVVTADKTLYALDPSATASNQVYRTIDPQASTLVFQWITGLTATASMAISVVPAFYGNTIAIAQGATVQLYTDNLSAGSPTPKILAPVDKFAMTQPNMVTFSLDNKDNTKVTAWDVQISTDANFINNTSAIGAIQQVPSATQVVATISTVITPNDQTIYWRTRAATPLIGPWSATRTIIPQLTIAPNFPAQIQPSGATAINVSTKPVFNWGAYKFATGYELQVSKDAAFTTKELVVDLSGAKKLGNVTSYALTTALSPSTAYFWRVRAVTAAGASTDWSPGVGFTTAAPAAPPVTVAPPAPVPTIIVPPQPTPTIILPTPTTITTQVTPAWIYAIIAIGAILVIAVIVLIIRTRRPA